jgi:hypothetical protein
MRWPVVLSCVTVALVSGATIEAQWLNYPTRGVPRTADGKPDLSAPAPRTADGKPDFSGIWQLEANPPKPWTVTLRQRIVVDTELLDYHCTDNERDAPHMVGK